MFFFEKEPKITKIPHSSFFKKEAKNGGGNP